MDFISWFLSVFGLAQAHSHRIADKRAEAFRLIAEISGEFGRANDKLTLEKMRLRHKTMNAYLPELNLVTLDHMFEKHGMLLIQIEGEAAKIHGAMLSRKRNTDWDRLIADLHSWQVNIKRGVLWFDDHVQHLNAILDQAMAETDYNGNGLPHG